MLGGLGGQQHLGLQVHDDVLRKLVPQLRVVACGGVGHQEQRPGPRFYVLCLVGVPCTNKGMQSEIAATAARQQNGTTPAVQWPRRLLLSPTQLATVPIDHRISITDMIFPVVATETTIASSITTTTIIIIIIIIIIVIIAIIIIIIIISTTPSTIIVITIAIIVITIIAILIIVITTIIIIIIAITTTPSTTIIITILIIVIMIIAILIIVITSTTPTPITAGIIDVIITRSAILIVAATGIGALLKSSEDRRSGVSMRMIGVRLYAPLSLTLPSRSLECSPDTARKVHRRPTCSSRPRVGASLKRSTTSWPSISFPNFGGSDARGGEEEEHR